MSVSIGNDSREVFFGRGMILGSIEAEPLIYSSEFPSRPHSDKNPEQRRVDLEGYIVSLGETTEIRQNEMELRRRILASITAPGNSFFLRVGDRYANLRDGELVFKRKAPFSGDETEHFTLRATIDGGFFLGESVTLQPSEGVIGTHFPLSVSDGGFVFGTYDGASVIKVKNRGDVSVGFTAELTPLSTVTGFRLENPATGQYIACSHSFGTGDVIRISTLRDDLYMRLLRGGREINLTGYADGGSELFLLPAGESMLTVGEGAAFMGNLTFRESYVTF